MQLKQIIEELQLTVLVQGKSLETPVAGAYVSDLLSDVMANSLDGQLWITLQIHINIVAVAVLKELSAIILINNRIPEKKILDKAQSEGVTLLSSPLQAFELAGRLHRLLTP
jgi:hypothetical protein